MKQILLTLLVVAIHSVAAQAPPNPAAPSPAVAVPPPPAPVAAPPGQPAPAPPAVAPPPPAVPTPAPAAANSTQPPGIPANSTVTALPAANATLPAAASNATTTPVANSTTVGPPTANATTPVVLPANTTQASNVTTPAANHVSIMSIDPVNVAASQNGTSLSLNETHPAANSTVTKPTPSPVNSTLPAVNGTTLTIGQNMTITLTNSTESVVLNKTVQALNTAAADTYRLIQDVSNEISWIQTHLPLRSNNLTISISEICRRIRQLFLDSRPHFASYYIADLQHFSATVEKLVARIGKNISELYDDFSQTVTLHIMNTTTLIADTATNISRMLKNATEEQMAKVCVGRLTPQVMAYGEHYIKILGACSTDQEARVKAIASNTMVTCSSLFSQGLEIVQKLNDCMDGAHLSVNASQVCVTDVCSQLQLAALNIEMDALMIQAGITFDIETLRDRVTYCSLMRSVEATNKANILMQMSSLCLAGQLK